MIVAVGQPPAHADPALARDAAADLVRAAAAAGADLVVLPEYAAAYDPGSPARHAEPLDGPFARTTADLAAELGVAVVGGLVEDLGDGGPPANTVLAVGPDGSHLGAYRKIHLYDAFGDRESDRLRRVPPRAVVVEIGGLSVGLMTCYDLRFPEMARFLVDAGAEVLLVPAAWVAGPGKAEQWEVLLRARAVENTAYVVAAGLVGRRLTGRSMVVGPAGELLARLGEEPGLDTAEVTAERVAGVREVNPSLRNRRFEVRPLP